MPSSDWSQYRPRVDAPDVSLFAQDAAYKLSSVLPKVISVPLNPAASRNVLAATLCDLTEAIQYAKPVQLPNYDDWLDTRNKKARAHTRARDGVAGESEPNPLGNSPNARRDRSEGAAEDFAAEPRVEAGSLLLELAKAFPSVLPLSFIIQVTQLGTARPHVISCDAPLPYPPPTPSSQPTRHGCRMLLVCGPYSPPLS